MTDHRSTDPDEEFFEALAGRRMGDAGAESLRAALLEEARIIEEAASAPLTQPTPIQLELRARIKAELLANGTFLDASANLPPSDQAAHTVEQQAVTGFGRSRGRPVPQAPGALSRLTTWLSTWTIPQMSGLAASVLLGVVVVMNVGGLHGDDDQGDVLRGGASLSVAVPDPARVAETLAARVQDLGGSATVVQMNDMQWNLLIEVETAEAIAPVRTFLRKEGFPVGEMPPYELSVMRSR